MRIAGYIDHPHLKITVFTMDTRLSVKFEIDQLEQTYKFPKQAGLERLSDMQALVDDTFLKSVERRFQRMQKDLLSAMQRHLPPSDAAEFDEII